MQNWVQPVVAEASTHACKMGVLFATNGQTPDANAHTRVCTPDATHAAAAGAAPLPIPPSALPGMAALPGAAQPPALVLAAPGAAGGAAFSALPFALAAPQAGSAAALPPAGLAPMVTSPHTGSFQSPAPPGLPPSMPSTATPAGAAPSHSASGHQEAASSAGEARQPSPGSG